MTHIVNVFGVVSGECCAAQDEISDSVRQIFFRPKKFVDVKSANSLSLAYIDDLFIKFLGYGPLLHHSLKKYRFDVLPEVAFFTIFDGC